MADLQDHETNQEVFFTAMKYFLLFIIYLFEKILGFIYPGFSALMIRYEKKKISICLLLLIIIIDLGVLDYY